MITQLPSDGINSLGDSGAISHGTAASQIMLALAVILLAAKVGSSVARRLKLPEVLGELVAGIVIGNLALIGFSGLDYIQDDRVITILSEIGAVLLLFEVGLETHLGEMLKVGWSAMLAAVLGVVAPFALGWVVADLMLPEQGALVNAFCGTVLCATSVGITARVLKDCGKIQSAEGRIILGAAVIDDILGLLVLAVMTGIIQSVNSGGELEMAEIGKIGVLSFSFLIGTIVIGRLVLSRTARIIFTRGSRTTLPMGLIICFALSYLANLVGLAPIVGAFAAGVIIDPTDYREFTNREQHKLLDELIHPLTTLFVPIFFIVMGAHVDLLAFVDPGVLGFALALTAAAVIGKQICGLGVLQRGVDRIAVGLGMIPRGEVGLIFAGIGVTLTVGEEPVVNAQSYAAIVVMVILTTLVTPPLLKWRLTRQQ